MGSETTRLATAARDAGEAQSSAKPPKWILQDVVAKPTPPLSPNAFPVLSGHDTHAHFGDRHLEPRWTGEFARPPANSEQLELVNDHLNCFHFTHD
jgi:hypothetical protein